MLLLVLAATSLLTSPAPEFATLLHAEGGDNLNVPPDGFVALFNGKDLSGWFGHGTEDPRSLWAMSKNELAAHQEKTLDDIR